MPKNGLQKSINKEASNKPSHMIMDKPKKTKRGHEAPTTTSDYKIPKIKIKNFWEDPYITSTTHEPCDTSTSQDSFADESIAKFLDTDDDVALLLKQPPPSGNYELVRDNTEYLNVDLGDAKRFVINVYKGSLRFNIRVFEEKENGRRYPTKKGVSLDSEEYKKVHFLYRDAIEQAITDVKDDRDTDFKAHLGENIYVSVKSGYKVVDFRRWFLPDGNQDVIPTKRGVTLRFNQWKQLNDVMAYVEMVWGEHLREIEYCETKTDHSNQLAYLSCTKCNPNHRDVIPIM